MNNNYESQRPQPVIFTPKERKLYELLSNRDETGQLPRMFEGAVKVLSDSRNPDRFSQAANTIRGIADILLDHNRNKMNKPQAILKREKFGELKPQFEIILGKSLERIIDCDDKDETRQQADREFDRLQNILSYGARTKKHQLLDLIGLTKNLRILPKSLQENAEKLVKTYKYFANVLHHHQGVEPDFMTNWLFFQDFLILVTSRFFDIAKEIDPFLEKETISNEKSR